MTITGTITQLGVNRGAMIVGKDGGAAAVILIPTRISTATRGLAEGARVSITGTPLDAGCHLAINASSIRALAGGSQ